MVFPTALIVSGTGWLDAVYSIGEDVRGYPTWWADNAKVIFTDKHGAWGISDGGFQSIESSECCIASGDGDVHSHYGTPPHKIISWMIFSNGGWIQNTTCFVTSPDSRSEFHDPALMSPSRSRPLRSPSPPRESDSSLLHDINALRQKVQQLETANQSLQKYSTHTETESLRQRISQLEAEQSLRRTEAKKPTPAITSISSLYGRAGDSFTSGGPLGPKRMSTDYAKVPTSSVKTPAAASDAELSSVKQRLQKLELQLSTSNHSSVTSAVDKKVYKSPSPPDAVSVTSSRQMDDDILHKQHQRPLGTPSPPETTPQEASLVPQVPGVVASSNSKTSAAAAGTPVQAAAEVPFFTKSVRTSLSSMRTPGRSNNFDPDNDAARFDTPTRVRYSPSVNFHQTPPAAPLTALPAAAVSTPGQRSSRSRGRRSRSGRSRSGSRSRSRSRSPGAGTRRTPKRSPPPQGSVKSPLPSPILEAARELRERSSSPLDLPDQTPPAPTPTLSTRSKRRSRSRSPHTRSVTHGFYEVYRHDRSTAVPITMRTTTPFVGLLASRGMQGYTKFLSDVELWSNATGVINVDSTPAEVSIIGTEDHPVQLFFRLRQPKSASSPLRPLTKVPVNSGDQVSPERSPLGSVKSPANANTATPNDFYDASEKYASSKSANNVSQSYFSTHPSVRGRSRKVTSPR